MAIENEQLGEILSSAISERSKTYVDLVSNSNVLLSAMRKHGMWKSYTGPSIRQTLQLDESDTYTRYSGFDYLNPKAAPLLGDAEFTPKMAAVTIAISNEQLLGNAGDGQIFDIMEVRMEAAERELQDRFCEDLHSDGTADGGLQITGLQQAIPTDPTVGVYGNIDRATTPTWRTQTFTAGSGLLAGKDASVQEDLIDMWTRVAVESSVGRNGPSLILASTNHYLTAEKAFRDIQRITTIDSDPALGAPAKMIVQLGGRRMEVIHEGGQGSAMPTNVSYFVDPKGLAFRYNEKRNFKPFGGTLTPVNQDAVVRKVGIMGELVLANPRHASKFIG